MEYRGRNTPPKLLVVEDDPGVMRMLRITLRGAGFDIIEATTTAEALRCLQEQAPDVVALDLGLPDGPGGAVLERLRQLDHPPGCGPAWVVITALGREDAIRQYGPLGGAFLAKPFDPGHLVSMLQGVSGGWRGRASPKGRKGKGGKQCTG